MKFRILLSGGCVLGALLSTGVLATPVLGIGSMYDVITPDSQSMTKRIYNTGTSTAFSRVDVLEIDPTKTKGTAETPQREIISDNINKNRLIVTPSRLIIPPGGGPVGQNYLAWRSESREILSRQIYAGGASS